MKDFLIGHYDDGYTGVSVLLCEKGARGGVDVRGGAPGTRETDLLKPGKTVDVVHAVVLSGGSAFGLEACSGVMEYLYKKGVGFRAGGHIVPIVTGAVLFDLNEKELRYPTKEFGIKACQNAGPDGLKSGSFGAGRGATVGKLFGAAGVSKGGIGCASVTAQGATVCAMVAVNAFGDVYDIHTNKIIAGTRLPGGAFADTENMLLNADLSKLSGGTNTTIGVVFTDADLTKTEANIVAQAAHNGLAKSIKPVHTSLDGDTLFVLSSGTVKTDINIVMIAAAEAVRQAVLNAV